MAATSPTTKAPTLRDDETDGGHIHTIPQHQEFLVDHKTRENVNSSPTDTSMKVPDSILQLPKEIRNIIAGGIAGMVAKSIVAPVDRIKILYQISSKPFHLLDVPKVAYNIIQTEGIIALWKGNLATMIRVFPYSGIQFMTYEFCKSHYLRSKEDFSHLHNRNRLDGSKSTLRESSIPPSTTAMPNRTMSNRSTDRIPSPLDPVINPSSSSHTEASKSGYESSSDTSNDKTASSLNNNNSNRHDRKYGLSPMESLIAGMIAGTVSVICTYPLDLVRAQLAVLKHHHHKNKSSTSIGSSRKATVNHGFIRVIRDNYGRAGVSGLFRGITPTLIGILPYSGIAFTLNEQGKRELQHYTGRDVTTMERLQCGAFSGLIAQTVTYPIEVTRRRMQTIGLLNQNDTALSSCLGDVKSANSLQKQHQSQPPTLYSTIMNLYKEQGARGFVKGVSMNWMKGPVAFAISFTTFDYMKNILENSAERHL